MRTPFRCLRLFAFAFLVPSVLIAIPLYQRRVTNAPRLYTLTATDMRGVQEGVSSVWCEAQELSSEATFTTYRTGPEPKQSSRRQPVTIHHRLTLLDDVKEFWGLYLLSGSRISVSACARYPGTSLLLVQGWEALNECVWVGQMDSIEEESSEEEEEDDDETLNHDLLDPVRMRWRQFIREEQQRSGGKATDVDEHHTDDGDIQKDPDDDDDDVDDDDDEDDDDDMDDEDDIDDDDAEKRPFIDEDAEGADDAEKSEARRRRSASGPAEGYRPPQARRRHPAIPRPESHSRQRLTNDIIERAVSDSEQGERRRRRSAAGVPRGVATAPPTTESPSTVNARLAEQKRRIIPLTYNGHRGRVNQSLAQKETSHSEMMSSFSSSEEALQNCAGVLLNQPLEAVRSCSPLTDPLSRRLVQQVLADDFYYLVFSSENEVLPVDVFFDVALEKTVYDLREAQRVCTNTSSCQVQLSFWSSDQTVVEFPVVDGVDNEAVWSEHFTVRSTCVARGWVVAMFIVAAICSLFICAFC